MFYRVSRLFGLSVLLLLLSACGGGGGGGGDGDSSPVSPPPSAPSPPPSTPAPPPGSVTPVDPNPFGISNQQANRFLRQASFGPAPNDVSELQALGYPGWIDEQLSLPASFQLSYLASFSREEIDEQGQTIRLDAFFRNAVQGDDQLRQRVAFALSEIMVVSELSVLEGTSKGLAYYYDLLTQQAFGNFRELMKVVTLSPAMGVYLSMLGNEKPNIALNIRPDENYARELMQLFTIGLVQLNLDGSVILDEEGQAIPTYDQDVIKGFAHVYTGWTFGGSPDFHDPNFNFTRQMQNFAEFHDNGAKRLLNGVVIAAGQTGEEDLAQALDTIFMHPNVGPFISRRLIQRLVSANPSPAYVQRTATVFNDDGRGVRGNLGAVVKALLLDPEARDSAADDTSGKLTEPLLRLIALWRAYEASAQNGRYIFEDPQFFFGQAPLRASSVFNFFSPDYAPSGEISTLGLVSPEMQITHETTTASTNNFLAFAIFELNSSNQDLDAEHIAIDIETDLPFASDVEALVNRVANRLLGGDISPGLRQYAVDLATRIPADQSAFRVAEVIHAIATSPEFAIID